MRNKPRLPSEI